MIAILENKKVRNMIRLIAIALVTTFIAQDIAWAYPDSFAARGSQDNNKLAPSPFVTREESIISASAAYLEAKIEGSEIFRSNPTLAAVGAILSKAHKEDEWFGKNISYTATDRDILITFSFMPGYMLRYYDHTYPDIQTKYGNKKVTEATIREGQLCKELIKVESLPPAKRDKGLETEARTVQSPAQESSLKAVIRNVLYFIALAGILLAGDLILRIWSNLALKLIHLQLMEPKTKLLMAIVNLHGKTVIPGHFYLINNKTIINKEQLMGKVTPLIIIPFAILTLTLLTDALIEKYLDKKARRTQQLEWDRLENEYHNFRIARDAKATILLIPAILGTVIALIISHFFSLGNDYLLLVRGKLFLIFNLADITLFISILYNITTSIIHNIPTIIRIFRQNQKEKTSGTFGEGSRAEPETVPEAKPDTRASASGRAEVVESVGQYIAALKDKTKGKLFIGFEGLDASGKSHFVAEELAPHLRAMGKKVEIVKADWTIVDRWFRWLPWHRRYENWFEYTKLVEWLEKLSAPGDVRLELNGLYNSAKERRVDSRTLEADDDTIVLVDGLFLQRPEIKRFLNKVIYFDITKEESFRRQMERDPKVMGRSPRKVKYLVNKVFLPAHERYERAFHPRENADMVIDNNDLNNPRVIFNTSVPPGDKPSSIRRSASGSEQGPDIERWRKDTGRANRLFILGRMEEALQAYEEARETIMAGSNMLQSEDDRRTTRGLLARINSGLTRTKSRLVKGAAKNPPEGFSAARNALIELKRRSREANIPTIDNIRKTRTIKDARMTDEAVRKGLEELISRGDATRRKIGTSEYFILKDNDFAKMLEEELVVIIQDMQEGSADRNAMLDILFDRYYQQIRAAADKHAQGDNDIRDDLVLEGRIALWDAVNNWILTDGYTFQTYAFQCVDGVMRRWKRDRGYWFKVSRVVKEGIPLYDKIRERFLKDEKRLPTPEEVFSELSEKGFNKGCLTMEDVTDIIAMSKVVFVSLADNVMMGPEGSEEGQMLVDRIAAAEGISFREELEKILQSGVEGLDERDIEIARLYYVEDMSQREVASMLKPPVSQNHVSRLLRRKINPVLRKAVRGELPEANVVRQSASGSVRPETIDQRP